MGKRVRRYQEAKHKQKVRDSRRLHGNITAPKNLNSHQRQHVSATIDSGAQRSFTYNDRHSCLDKMAYGSLAEARSACHLEANRLNKPMGVYKCMTCRMYHLTHKVTDDERSPTWPPLRYVAEPHKAKKEPVKVR